MCGCVQVCVCVSEREREKERERDSASILGVPLNQLTRLPCVFGFSSLVLSRLTLQLHLQLQTDSQALRTLKGTVQTEMKLTDLQLYARYRLDCRKG